MKKLELGELVMPALDAQTGTMIVYGGKGMGKTNFGSVFVEELDRHNLRFSWIDPVGVAWGLKHSADGKGAGIEVVILGGRHGHIPIEPTAGAVVADFVVDEEVSVLIDISRHADGRMWTHGEKIRFVRDYCNRLFQRQGENRRPLLQVIDECGRFAPQQFPKGSDDIAGCLGAVEQLVELGRNVGVGVLLMTQRSARMAKSVSELADMMVAFRTIGPRSVDSIIDWFGEHVPKDRQRELVERLRQLPRGTALVVSPGWLGIEGQYSMRPRQTFDSSDTPRAGAERKPSGKGAQPDLAKFQERMRETIEKADAEDPTKLQRQLREQRQAVRERDERIRKLLADLEARPTEVETEIQVEEVEKPVPYVPDEIIEAHKAALKVFDAVIIALQESKEPIAVVLRRMEALMRDGDGTPDRTNIRTNVGTKERPKPQTRRPESPKPRTNVGTNAVPEVPPPPPAPGVPDEPKHVKAGGKRMLEALARAYPDRLTRKQAATLAGMSAKLSGSFSDYLSVLKGNGYVLIGADDRLTITEAGFDFLGTAPAAPMTTEELVAMWRGKLKRGGRLMFDYLIEQYPEPVDRVTLATAGNMSPDLSGSFSDYLSVMRRNGLIEDMPDGSIKAADTLFPEVRVG